MTVLFLARLNEHRMLRPAGGRQNFRARLAARMRASWGGSVMTCETNLEHMRNPAAVTRIERHADRQLLGAHAHAAATFAYGSRSIIPSSWLRMRWD